jgi:hypothetical protein
VSRIIALFRSTMRTLRARLILGLVLLIAGVVTGVLVGVFALRLMTRDIDQRVTDMTAVTATNGLLQSGLLTGIAASEAYLASPSPELRDQVSRTGLETHGLRKLYRRLSGLTPEERALVDSIGRLQARLEVDFGLAHALLDLGRAARSSCSRCSSSAP